MKEAEHITGLRRGSVELLWMEPHSAVTRQPDDKMEFYVCV